MSPLKESIKALKNQVTTSTGTALTTMSTKTIRETEYHSKDTTLTTTI